MSILSQQDRHALHTIGRMVAQIRQGQDARGHIRADLQAYVSELALEGGVLRGDLLTVIYWKYPGLIDYRPVADVLGVLPSSLRLAVGV